MIAGSGSEPLPQAYDSCTQPLPFSNCSYITIFI